MSPSQLQVPPCRCLPHHTSGHTHGVSCPGDRHPPSWALPCFALVRDITVTVDAVTPPRTSAGAVSPNGSPRDSSTRRRPPRFRRSARFHVLWSEAHHARSPRRPVCGAPLRSGGRGPQGCAPSEPETRLSRAANQKPLPTTPRERPSSPRLAHGDSEGGTPGAPPRPRRASSAARSLAITLCVSVLDVLDVLTAQLSGRRGPRTRGDFT